MDEPAQQFEVAAHGGGIDRQPVDHAGEAVEREVERRGGVGADPALHRRMRDVALVPQRHVLQRRGDRRADQPRQAGEVLGKHRVALVRHGRRALLPLGEELLRLAQLGALEVADLGRQALHRRRRDSERGEERRMPVARDHLGRDRLYLEAQAARDVRLHRRVDVGEGPDGAGDRAGRRFGARRLQPAPVAREFGVGLRQFEAEGGRLGVDAVAAPDARREFVLARATLQRGEERVEIGEKDVGGAGQLDREAGVEHVRRRHAPVQEARLRADMLGDVGEEGDDVVFDLALDGVDARDLEPPALGDGGGDSGRDLAQQLLRLAGVALDVEPYAEFGLRRPERRHVRPRVARDHRQRGAAARLPPSTVASAPVVPRASARCTKACATSAAVTSRPSRLPAM